MVVGGGCPTTVELITGAGALPLEVTFTALTSPPTTKTLSYRWDFGDKSGPGQDVNPTTHTYALPGTYTATVTVSADGCPSISSSVTVTVTKPCPQLTGLTATPASGPAPLQVAFQAAVENPSAFTGPYQWDFGDGSTAQTTTPGTSHTYQSPGDFTATVTAGVPAGCPATRASVTVKPTSPCPQLFGMSGTSGTGPPPLTVSFQVGVENASAVTGPYQWDFGDGSAAQTTTPTTSHTYQSPGDFTATVTVGVPAGCPPTQTSIVIKVTSPCPQLTALAAAPASGTAPLQVGFQVTVENAFTFAGPYKWDFGDGSTAETTTTSVSHTYQSPGDFTASVTVDLPPRCPPTQASATVTATSAGGRLAAGVPVLLLPVRIETRFVDAQKGPELRLRVYPAQIAIDAHRRGLASGEIRAGLAYWTTRWHAAQEAGGDQAGAWRSLAARYGPRRAAWIALQTQPAAYDPATATFKPGEPLLFNPPAASSDAPAPHVAALPDSWVAFLWDSATSAPQQVPFPSPITQDLKVMPDPQTAASQDLAAAALDPGTRWLVDFDEAVAKGMAASVPLTPGQRQTGFARIMVAGLRTNVSGTAQTPELGAAALQDLLAAHHYAKGLAFVPQGAASKNTPDASAAFSRQDPGFEASFATEQGPPLTRPPDPTDPAVISDSAAALTFLGLDPSGGVFDHVQGADGLDQQDAADMAVTLWPGTVGYFLREIAGMQSAAQLAAVDTVRELFVRHVRARGPVPALRTGDTPYGIVPVTSLQRWQPATPVDVPAWLLPYAQKALPIWRQSYSNTPRIGATSDPDADLTGILGMDASSTSYQARSMMGPLLLWNTMQWFQLGDQAMTRWMQYNRAPGEALWRQLGFGSVPEPIVVQASFEPQSWPVPGPVVQSGPLSESDPLPAAANYISWLLDAQSIDDIRNERFPGPAPTALLYRLLRHSLLTEYANSAQDVLLDHNLITAGDLAEAEFVNFPSKPTVTRWDQLATAVPGLGSPGQPIGSYIKGLEQNPAALAAQFPRLAALRAALARLAGRPTAKLGRVLSETLDVCGYRLDAWMTAAATALVLADRDSERGGPGLHLGMYSWAENVTPAQPAGAGQPLSAAEQSLITQFDTARQAANPGGPALATVQPPPAANGGFIQAPSSAQGAAGAILRAGYLTHEGSTNGQLLAVDLSSDRVRTALWYLDGVRQGQPLGALLGYRFEAQLIADTALAPYLQPFRDRYPLVANKLTTAPDPATPTESLAAPNVTDGLALQRAWAAGTIPWGPPLPAPQSTGQQAIINVLDDLTNVMDALGDVSLAESVYQIVRGNPGRAGGILGAISRGERPPEVEVLDTPHGGQPLTHRLLVLFPGKPAALAWTSGRHNPRAEAEAWLDRWARNLLPDPKRVKCWVQYDPGPPAPATLPEVALTLDELGAGPLDLLAMSATADTPQLSELEQRILYLAYQVGHLPPGARAPQVRFDGPLDRAKDISVPDLMTVLRAVRDVLGSARALAPGDLTPPGGTPTPPGGGPVDAKDLQDRATKAASHAADTVTRIDAAIGTLQDAITNPGTSDIQAAAQTARDVLIEASWFGIAGSVPHAAAADGTAVTGVSVAVDPAAARYTVSFRTSPGGALSPGDTVTLLAPPGTAFSRAAGDYQVNGQAVQTAPLVMPGTVKLSVPAAVGPSAQITVVAAKVTSPPAGSFTLSIVTSADSLATVSPPYAVAAATGTSVSTPAVTVGVPAPAATGQCTVTFTTSPAGALNAGTGTITLLAPPGTAFSAQPGDYQVNGQAVPAPAAGGPSPVQVSDSQVTITVPADIHGAALVTVLAARVTNPGATTYTLATTVTNPGTGTYTLAVATSADTNAACGSAGFALGPLPTLIAQARAAASELEARAAALPRGVNSATITAQPSRYTAGFKTSPEGALAGGAGTIELLATPATVFSGSPGDYTVNGQPVQIPPVTGAGTVTISVPADIGPAADVTVAASNVTSPGPGTYTLSMATSADTLAVSSPGYTIAGAGTAVSAVDVTLDPQAQAWAVGFTTSGSGTLTQQHAATITVLAPPGTSFSAEAADYSVNGVPVTAAPLVTGNTVTVAVPADVGPSTKVTLAAANVTSPRPGSYTLCVVTSADTLAACSTAYDVLPTAAQWTAVLQVLFGKGFAVLPRFTPANPAELDGAFGDTGHLLHGDPAAPSRWLQQLTHVRQPVSRIDMAWSLAQVLTGAEPPGFTIAQLPRLPNDTWLARPLPSAISGVSVSLAPPAAAASATYRATFTTSDSGALGAGAQVTLTAPPGTVLPTSAGDYAVTMPGDHTASVGAVAASSWPDGGPTANQATLTLAASSIAAGDLVTVSIVNAQNPASPGDYALSVFTSADPGPVLSASYTVTGEAAATGGAPPGGGRLSLVAMTGAGYDPARTPLAGGPVSGLVLDEWPEQIPNRAESAAVVFNYQEPTARAPQALLLAVNPTGQQWWLEDGYDLIRAILEETFDLAKIRTVDLASLSNGGQLLPALYLPANPTGDTITVNLAGIRSGQAAGIHRPPQAGA
jgi:PKD domain